MFWLMFEYGLVVAILAHAVYDALIATVHYIDAHYDTRRDAKFW